MTILVTAGNTLAMIDRVRAITNVFSGRTGAAIALEAAQRGHTVTLLTSHPETIPAGSTVNVRPYRTFEDLAELMAHELRQQPGAVVHAAAVGDYQIAGVYSGTLTGNQAEGLIDVRAGKVKGAHHELWLRLLPAPKLVDLVRTAWGFTGTLVKFKLEVDVTEAELLRIAEASRLHSHADLMVANTLDGAAQWAFIGAGEYQKVPRPHLARSVVNHIEALQT